MKPFVVVIASFNNAPWCHKNLESVLNQDYPRYRVIYVDDNSTDDTARLVDEYLAARDQAHRVKFIRNEIRVGPLSNIDTAVRSCDPDEVVVLVDGDDFLAHPQVLSRLNTIYQDPDVWVTWGQFIRYPAGTPGFCAPIPAEVVGANAFRDFPFVSSHLRTFYAGLYNRIHLVDLKDDEGEFYNIAGDVAQMFALQEMAGPHGRFVAEVLYKYNRENPLNDDKLDRPRQLRTENEIREKARYGRVPKLSGTSPPTEFCIAAGTGRSVFGVSGPLLDSEWWRRPFRQARSVINRLGYTVRETPTLEGIEDPHRILVIDVRPQELDKLTQYPSDKLTLLLWKDPVAAPGNFEVSNHALFGRIYTWRDDLVDNVRYFKIHLPFMRPMIKYIMPFENRQLCTVIASHRYSNHPAELHSEERKLAEFLASKEGESFDLFSSGWSPTDDQNYWGIVPTQINALRRFKFSFCYEPVSGMKGLITAKIFDSFAAGCVPVYWGAPDIADSVPADCFIAREAFGSNEELHAFLKNMTGLVHEEYLECIRAFLSSQQALRYTGEDFARTLVGMARPRAATATDAANRSIVARASERVSGEALRERN